MANQGSVVSERGQIMLAPEVSIDPETNGFKRTPQYSAEAVGRCWLKVSFVFAIQTSLAQPCAHFSRSMTVGSAWSHHRC